MLQSFKLAIKAILSNKIRSLLTMLGIIIGVAAVIILVSIVSGYMGQMVQQFEEMGVNKITVFCRNMNTRHFDDTDMYDFWDEHPDWLAGVSPSVTLSNAKIKSGSDNLESTSITGVSEDYADIQKYTVEEGRSLVYADIAGRSSVCVVGSYVANTFYGSPDKAVDDTVKINGKPFTIVGVIETQDEDNFDEGGTDDFIWIPYTVATKMGRNGFINNYVLISSDTAHTDAITSELKSKLNDTFKNERLYNVTANSSIIKQLNESIGTLTAMLAGIAGISLLVAGIGVMNIMLVSVTERTREIGIRKALGARQGVIMQQFVIEAAVTSTIGGVMGIGIGALATKSIGAMMDINANPTVWAVILSFGVSVAIGLIFGYVPAKNAARLNPIDALRTD
ncbi:MAG: ABC transporter permease [Lachnospiraceae bacterium]|nr:ABC transporter permease [Lachnospiraceae bacterium]